MAKHRGVAQDKSEIVAKLPAACTDERKAVEFVEEQRWNGKPECPLCGSADVYQMRDSKTGQRSTRFLWVCRGCGKQFTVRKGTVFEDSRIPLKHWCFAFWSACSSKKGVSALQIKRETGLSYKSALFLMHRIRFAMADDVETQPKLTGTVEADETYVGGKPRHSDYVRGLVQEKRKNKSVVMAMVQRGGEVRTLPLTRVGGSEIKGILLERVDPSARLVTDDEWAYRKVGRMFEGGHDRIRHSRHVYVRGDVYTNTVEGFFSIFKRGINGVYHSVSKRHLHRYLAEFEFRYNARGIDDGARTALAIKKAEGKRLTYREPTAIPRKDV
jgi:transposase-like protein